MRIEEYGMIGDLQTAALVGSDGSIDWLCLPRFDSAACFAALLGGDEHGSWRLGPAEGGRCTRRRYRGDTLILETEWDTPQGSVRVTDAMPPRGEAADVVRVVEGLGGRVLMRTEMRLRFGYGKVTPWVRCHEGHLSAIAGPDAAWLDADVPLVLEDAAAHAEFSVGEGQKVTFVLTHQPSHHDRPPKPDALDAIADTEAFWTDWIEDLRYEGEWSEAVRRSVITLKALTYAPTGGILAAATTSLPEEIGGVRNWDYRFCWLRDASFVLQAMLGTGFLAEAKAWRQWLLRAAAGDPAELQIMYGLDGLHWLPENVLDWLPGYEGSAPVRIGNAATRQFQLDVWGETIDALHLARQADGMPDEDAWDLQLALMAFVSENWDRPDDSLWEVRGEQRHFVHSKVMAWAAFDRAVQAVERFGLDGPVERWRELRDRVHAQVCEQGFDASRNTFTQFYGSKGLDAALLLLPQVGFLPWSDPRIVGTVEAVQRELAHGEYVLRYDTEADSGVDGLPGKEGAFLACTFWLVDALHGIGRADEARELFERLLKTRNDLGLLSEEYDPRTGRHLGNTPQAYSHVGLVNSARRLSGAHSAKDPHAVERQGTSEGKG
nr:glycoside hydrolase family 15 protein [Glycomyces amatae]